ncbi:DUF1178 family protein [Curvibacter gracilis]|uniref:DUF1178 family protein n=1 Tax=Curvibacter gracilis TaxID=230310 RepID=UPI0004871706|nr:DUF1178 family protein [Curvibacter gracilis]
MKVLNLQCAAQHGFEGWFASEAEFQRQLAEGLVSCPVCGDHTIHKLPAAPRLNLSASREVASRAPSPGAESQAVSRPGSQPGPQVDQRELQAAWLKLAREVVRQTEDVGTAFAEEARRIHHGEAPERGIRGQATVQETLALVEEGIPVLPLPMPAAAKETLQ